MAKATKTAEDCLKAFMDRMEKYGEWDDGCFYYNHCAATELQEPIRDARELLGYDFSKGVRGKYAGKVKRQEYCDGCDGTGLMEGWNHRDGNACPKCKGKAVIVVAE